jgi:hypothetical protein
MTYYLIWFLPIHWFSTRIAPTIVAATPILN